MEKRGRQSMLISARLRLQDQDEVRAVLLKDVSANGAKVKGEAGLSLDSGVHLDLPNIGVVAARVIWVQSGLAGLRFELPIEPKALRTTVSGHYKRAPSSSQGSVKRIL
jgi:hypothetical protein